MIEVEIKLPVADLSAISQKLEELSFKLTKEVHEVDTYYTGTFHNMREHDEALRIRSYTVKNTPEENRFLVTFKGPKLDSVSMSRKELETEIADPTIMNSILNALDYHEAGIVSKYRKYYLRNNITVCVDSVENLGAFIEAEILAENESQRESSLLQLKSVLKELNLNFDNTITTSYLSMLQNKTD